MGQDVLCARTTIQRVYGDPGVATFAAGHDGACESNRGTSIYKGRVGISVRRNPPRTSMLYTHRHVEWIGVSTALLGYRCSSPIGIRTRIKLSDLKGPLILGRRTMDAKRTLPWSLLLKVSLETLWTTESEGLYSETPDS